MKVTFRIIEEIFSVEGCKVSRFYCQHKFLWGWISTFPTDPDDGGEPPEAYFGTKREALEALRDAFDRPRRSTCCLQTTSRVC